MSILELVLDPSDEDSAREPLPSRAAKLSVLDRLDRTSDIVRPLRELAVPIVIGLAAAGALLTAVLWARARWIV